MYINSQITQLNIIIDSYRNNAYSWDIIHIILDANNKRQTKVVL